jgi:rsbT co-antagonist protein RsbR
MVSGGPPIYRYTVASPDELRAHLAAAHADVTRALADGRSMDAALAAMRAAGEALADALDAADAIREAREEQIAAQRAIIADMGCPILQLDDHTLLVPLVGEFDAGRIVQLVDVLLTAAVTRRAHTAVIDLTGAIVRDPATAGNLAAVFQALRLIGVQGLVSGVDPELAQLLADVPEGLRDVRCYGDLAGALDPAGRARHPRRS